MNKVKKKKKSAVIKIKKGLQKSLTLGAAKWTYITKNQGRPMAPLLQTRSELSQILGRIN